MSLHPVVAAAARGELPSWARASRSRIRHMRRVAELLERWARRAGLDDEECARWAAMGNLHDALKEEDPEVLRELVMPPLADLPDPVLHGPAVAERLRRDGVADEDFLRAVTYHTLGHPGLDRAGRALYAADFLEPGRKLRGSWRKGLRERMPAEVDAVVEEIVRARIRLLLDKGRPVRPETVAFWNELTDGGEAWARASEV